MQLGSQFVPVFRPGAVEEEVTIVMTVLKEGTFINPKTNKNVGFLEGLNASGEEMRIYLHEIRPVPATNLRDTSQLLNKRVSFRCVVNSRNQKVWEPFKIE